MANNSYVQLFELSPFPAVVSRLQDHTVVAVNASATELVGVSARDAIGASVSDYYADPSQRTALVERLRRDGRIDNVRLQIKRSTGEPFWVLASIRLITWDDEPAGHSDHSEPTSE